MKIPDDIRSMQQYLIEQSANKQWQCIEAGIDQYLGRKVTEADAPFIEIRYGTDDIKVFYKETLIGSITGSWNGDFESNLIKYMWIWTPNEILAEGMRRINEQREYQNIPVFKTLAKYSEWRNSGIEYDN